MNKPTKEEIDAKLEAHAKWLATRDTDHVEGERADFSGEDLSGVDLRGAELGGASLVKANLSNADLSGASLAGADLTSANLSGAKMLYVDLTFADLMDANLDVLIASPAVIDALSAVFASRMALKKTGLEWFAQHNHGNGADK